MLEYIKKLSLSEQKKFENQCLEYKTLLSEFNKVHNLSHFKDLDKEIYDSVKALDFKDLSFVKTAVDIGSGAGFPALFLALFLRADFHLFEPNAKKSAFLRLIKTRLKLANLHIHKEKIELFKPKFKADLITSRALMKVEPLIKLCEGFFDTNSLFLLYKGSELENELMHLKEVEIINDKQRKYCFIKGAEALKTLKTIKADKR
ncbi:16S rRNA (guanine(527)-N(7))-methyltransferase RsmG [Campylobacter sp. MIT 12-8780]|uniref:16S rRNA (guanine(527)-N(7))-methyltransferase RsmG n=1 Tax=Campylobacter sp. MIT 12-8780 TaxID=2202200 RepID=UPI00115CB1BF|nr:16S rRNA (guanine(527)-N(7))-methyltransferase RsmG [Campylobacter sp. MIT 12-8780]TQR42339.1 16S rRNA (guanine(527)-N(7))-methyltransferase RsmG [Campylobacter sp. MIT 12-8780]